MKKVIFDTNVLLSALIFDNIPETALKTVLTDTSLTLYTSMQIWCEIEGKFLGSRVFEIAAKAKRNLSSSSVTRFIEILKASHKIIQVQTHLDICRDPKDNMFLELALEIHADFLVSGDKDLLILGEFNHTKIINPNDFLTHLQF